MRKIDPPGIARRGIGVEREFRAARQNGGVVLESADTQLRPLQIDERGDRPAAFLLEVADDPHQLAHAVMRRMAHVDAEDIGAGIEQRRDGGAL
jgi:hypothetical protein